MKQTTRPPRATFISTWKNPMDGREITIEESYEEPAIYLARLFTDRDQSCAAMRAAPAEEIAFDCAGTSRDYDFFRAGWERIDKTHTMTPDFVSDLLKLALAEELEDEARGYRLAYSGEIDWDRLIGHEGNGSGECCWDDCLGLADEPITMTEKMAMIREIHATEDDEERSKLWEELKRKLQRRQR